MLVADNSAGSTRNGIVSLLQISAILLMLVFGFLLDYNQNDYNF